MNNKKLLSNHLKGNLKYFGFKYFRLSSW